MAQQIAKLLLSGSTTGKPVVVLATTSGSATQIHTAATQGSLDEVYLYATNNSTGSTLMTIGWTDNGTNPNSETASCFRVIIPNQSGRQLIVDGRLICSGSTIYSYAATASVIVIDGFVNRIT